MVIGSIQTFAAFASDFATFEGLDRLPDGLGVVVFGVVIRFLIGLALLGSLSFLSLLLSVSLFAPFQLYNGLRQTGIFRRTARRDGSNGTGLGQIMFVAFVAIGAVNTLVGVYKGVQSMTRRVLMFVETQILEVNPR